jgi:hypothetical protein
VHDLALRLGSAEAGSPELRHDARGRLIGRDGFV